VIEMQLLMMITPLIMFMATMSVKHQQLSCQCQYCIISISDNLKLVLDCRDGTGLGFLT